MLQKFVDKKVVLDHLKSVIEEKTVQLTDHLINRMTLGLKIAEHVDFIPERVAELDAIIKSLAGKNQTQHEKQVSKLDLETKKNLQTYVEQKREVENLEFAEKGIREHEDFLAALVELKEELEKENVTSTTYKPY